MYKNINDTDLPKTLPSHSHEEVWRVWIYWLENGKWNAHSSPSFYATEAGWRRMWAPKQRTGMSSIGCNIYRRIVVEKLEATGWVQVLDQVESNENSTWKLEDARR